MTDSNGTTPAGKPRRLTLTAPEGAAADPLADLAAGEGGTLDGFGPPAETLDALQAVGAVATDELDQRTPESETPPNAKHEGGHDWRKANLVTIAGKGDLYRCERCGDEFYRRGLTWAPPASTCTGKPKAERKPPKRAPLGGAKAVDPRLAHDNAQHPKSTTIAEQVNALSPEAQERWHQGQANFTAKLAAEVAGETEQEKLDREARVAGEVLRELPIEGGRVMQIPVEHLHPSPTNPRKKFVGLDELGASLKKSGQLVELLVRPAPAAPDDEQFEIIAGERRYRAAKLVGIETLRCRVVRFTDVETAEAQAIENLKRKDLDVLEEANSYEALRGFGWSYEQIAEKIRVSVSTVRARCKLIGLIAEARVALSDWLPSSVGVPLARINDAKSQAAAVAKLRKDFERDGEVNAREAIAWIQREHTRNLKGAPFDKKDDQLRPETPACLKCPKNTGCGAAQAGLFDDVPNSAGSVCTDVKCFNDKARLSWEQTAEKARAKGAEVLSPAEGAELFKFGQLGYDAKYVELDSPNPEDPKRRPWSELLEKLDAEKRPVVIVAPDRDLVPHRLVERKKVVDLLAAGGAKWAKAKVEQKQRQAKQREQAKAERAEEELNDLVRGDLAAHVARKLETKLPLPIWYLLASFLTADFLPDAVVKALGLKDPDEAQKFVDKGTDANALARLVITCALVDHPERGTDDFDTFTKKLAKFYDVSLGDLEKARQAAAEAEAKSEKVPVKPKKAK
jgi:ParB/RepB/Spo0J family partition protein